MDKIKISKKSYRIWLKYGLTTTDDLTTPSFLFSNTPKLLLHIDIKMTILYTNVAL